MNGLGFTVVSAVFLGLTVIFDDILKHKLYAGNMKLPFFISTALGSIIWLIVVPVAWYLGGDFTTLFTGALALVNREISIIGIHMPVALAVFIAGVATNQTLRHYFKNFDESSSVVIAMVIAFTPLPVFIAESFVSHTSWHLAHGVSIGVALLGMIGYELASAKKDGVRHHVRAFHLTMFVGYSVVYLVLMDYILAVMTDEWSMGHNEATLLALPYYFLGFGTGAVTIVRKDVRDFLKALPHKKDFFLLLVLLEVIGEGFYFFELFGLAELNATLVALIIGAHVVIVWLFGLWLERCGRVVGNVNGDVIIRVFNFTLTLPKGAIPENTRPYAQLACITLVLLGIALWPG